jgi:hypothetical protein
MVAGDVEQLTMEKAAGERPALVTLVVGPGSEMMLHEEGIMADWSLHLDGDWGG